MVESAAGSPAPFDFEKLQQLMELMEKHGLNEVNLRHGDEQWRLRRGVPTATFVSAPPAPMVAPTASLPAPSAAVSAAAPSAAADDGLLIIRSPTVGTYYSAQTPEDPPFVSVGTKVSASTTVCLIEAMKVFNPIAAELSGTIEAILVKNGDPVEFGQPLFKVRP
ncbi:MAG: acetyl-CoA carboxylase, biotin carboxyl carrier protein [Planctomycetales bacterium 12-60-4]|nr:MAG: acetyl-CoA carboxylase, biotin carboxyl carrier protein [Planctomycetales bacterium 12-60-4]